MSCPSDQTILFFGEMSCRSLLKRYIQHLLIGKCHPRGRRSFIFPLPIAHLSFIYIYSSEQPDNRCWYKIKNTDEHHRPMFHESHLSIGTIWFCNALCQFQMQCSLFSIKESSSIFFHTQHCLIKVGPYRPILFAPAREIFQLTPSILNIGHSWSSTRFFSLTLHLQNWSEGK